MSNEFLFEILETAPKTKDVVSADIKARVGVTVKANGKEQEIKSEQKVLAQKNYDSEPPRMWLDYGYTANLGNYESAKISIGLSLPVGPEIGEELKNQIQETKKQGMILLEKMMAEELKALAEWSKNKKEQANKSIF